MRASQSDYIIRLIEQLGAALARLREKLAGAGPGAADDVLEEARQTQGELFGPLWDVISRVDTQTAISLIPEKERLALWIDLLQIEADAARTAGQEAIATTRMLRIDELNEEVQHREAMEARNRILG